MLQLTIKPDLALYGSPGLNVLRDAVSAIQVIYTYPPTDLLRALYVVKLLTVIYVSNVYAFWLFGISHNIAFTFLCHLNLPRHVTHKIQEPTNKYVAFTDRRFLPSR